MTAEDGDGGARLLGGDVGGSLVVGIVAVLALATHPAVKGTEHLDVLEWFLADD